MENATPTATAVDKCSCNGTSNGGGNKPNDRDAHPDLACALWEGPHRTGDCLNRADCLISLGHKDLDSTSALIPACLRMLAGVEDLPLFSRDKDPVAGYEGIRITVRHFKGNKSEIIFDLVVHVPDLGRHNRTRQLAEALHAPVKVYPVVIVIYPRHGHENLIFWNPWRQTGLPEIKVHR